jgi:hypothetical protein
MFKHVCIGKPYDTKESLIRNIGNKKEKYNHLIFDNKKLIKIIDICPYSEDIIKMSEGNEYNFINDIPKPFYDFFQKYYESEVNIYNISLTSEELEDILLTNKLVDAIINYELHSDDHPNKLQKNNQYYYNYIFNDFITNYNNQLTDNDKYNYKHNYVKTLLLNKFNKYKFI